MKIDSVTIYGKHSCPFCTNAIGLCVENGFEYTYKLVGVHITKQELIEKIGKEIKTVPQIFVNGDQYIGGYEEFESFLNNNNE